MVKTMRNLKKRGGTNSKSAADETITLEERLKRAPFDIQEKVYTKLLRDEAILKKNTGDMSKLLVDAVKENNTAKARHALTRHGNESADFIKDEEKHGEMKTLLHISADKGNLEITKMLIELLITKEKKNNISAKDNIEQTPLHIAASKYTPHHYEIARLLIKNGADINAIDSIGETPIFWAVKANNIEMVKLLIENGSDVDHKNNTNNSILHYAAEMPNDNYKMFEYLLSLEISTNDGLSSTGLFKNIDSQTDDGKTNIDSQTDDGKTNIDSQNDNGKTNIDSQNDDGKTNIDSQNDNGKTNIDSQNDDGKTPLHFSAQIGNKNTAKFLVENGANKNVLDVFRQTPSDLAEDCEHIETKEIIEETEEIIKETDLNRTSNPEIILNIQPNSTRNAGETRGKKKAKDPHTVGKIKKTAKDPRTGRKIKRDAKDPHTVGKIKRTAKDPRTGRKIKRDAKDPHTVGKIKRTAKDPRTGRKIKRAAKHAQTARKIKGQ